MTESLKGRETEIDRWKDGETHWNKQAIGLHKEKKKKKFSKHFSWINILQWKYSEENNILECVEKLRPEQLNNICVANVSDQDFISPVIDN